MAAWRRAAGSEADDLPEGAALGLARRLGAGQLLLGGVVGTPDHVALNASLLPVAGRGPAGRGEGRRRGGQPAPTGGPADRPAHHRGGGGVARARGPGQPSASGAAALPRGSGGVSPRRLRRRGRPVRVGRSIWIRPSRMAGLRLASAAGWTTAPGAGRRGLERAWGSRDRLSPRDQALLLAEVGPDYPAVSTAGASIWPAWERAVDLAPDQPERWYELGDMYFHEGPYLQIESTRRRAAEAFRRSVALDSGTAPLGHLLEIAVLDGDDSAAVRRLARPVPGPRLERRAAGLLPLAHRRGAARRAGAGRTARAVSADGAAEPVADHELRGARRPPAGGRGVGRRRHPGQGGAELRLAAQQDLPARLRDQPRPSGQGAGGHGALGRGRVRVRTRRCTSESSTPCTAMGTA